MLVELAGVWQKCFEIYIEWGSPGDRTEHSLNVDLIKEYRKRKKKKKRP